MQSIGSSSRTVVSGLGGLLAVPGHPLGVPAVCRSSQRRPLYCGVPRVQDSGVVSSHFLRATVFSEGPSSPAHFLTVPLARRGVPAHTLASGGRGRAVLGSQPPWQGQGSASQGCGGKVALGYGFQCPSQLLSHLCGFGFTSASSADVLVTVPYFRGNM